MPDTALSTASTDTLQHVLLCRAIRRHAREIARLTVQLATMERKQTARYAELQRLEARILTAERTEANACKI